MTEFLTIEHVQAAIDAIRKLTDEERAAKRPLVLPEKIASHPEAGRVAAIWGFDGVVADRPLPYLDE